MRRRAHVIVFGNEKGGSGKSTTAMHVFVALARKGRRVGAIDLDVRQRSFYRYLENRRNWSERKGVNLLTPMLAEIRASTDPDRAKAWREEAAAFDEALERLAEHCDVIIIECPGAHSNLSRLGHSAADTLITPMNDSFVDFDLLARIDPYSFQISGPSVYAEMVWESRKLRAQAGLGPIDWVVVRNRMPLDDAKNKRRVGAMLEQLSTRIGFRIAPGLSERTIFRELFLSGLTLLDLREPSAGPNVDISHVAARQEVRELLAHLNIPGSGYGRAGLEPPRPPGPAEKLQPEGAKAYRPPMPAAVPLLRRTEEDSAAPAPLPTAEAAAEAAPVKEEAPAGEFAPEAVQAEAAAAPVKEAASSAAPAPEQRAPAPAATPEAAAAPRPLGPPFFTAPAAEPAPIGASTDKLVEKPSKIAAEEVVEPSPPPVAG